MSKPGARLVSGYFSLLPPTLQVLLSLTLAVAPAVIFPFRALILPQSVSQTVPVVQISCSSAGLSALSNTRLWILHSFCERLCLTFGPLHTWSSDTTRLLSLAKDSFGQFNLAGLLM